MGTRGTLLCITLYAGLLLFSPFSLYEKASAETLAKESTTLKELNEPKKTLSVSLTDLEGSWRILNSRQVNALSNIGVVGAVDEPRALGLVLVEPIRDLTLNEYATALLENSTLSELLIESVDELEFNGYNSLRLVYSGDESNGRFRYLSYVFIAHGNAYQVVAGGPVGLATIDTLKPFSRAVRLKEETEGVALERHIKDDEGVGWQIRSGTLSHLLSGLQFKSEQGWHALVGDALKRINTEAIAGLSYPKGQLNILVFERPCPHPEEPSCLTWARQDLMSDLSLNEGEGSYEFKYLGQAQTFKTLTHQGGLYTYLLHSVVHEKRALLTLVWTLAPKQGRGSETNSSTPLSEDESAAILWHELQSGLSLINRMSPSMRLGLNVELAQTQSQAESAQAHDAWMWGRYHHFESGLSWSKPSGMWLVKVSPANPRTPKDRLLTIEAPRYGLKSQLRVVSGQHQNQKRSHQQLWSELSVQLGQSRGECSHPRQGLRLLAQVESNWTQCTFSKSVDSGQTQLSLEWVYQLDSFEVHGAMIHLLSWAPQFLFEGEADPVREALEHGLSVDSPAAVTASPSGELTDERLRYQLQNLPVGGTLRVRPSVSLGAVASLNEYHTSDLSFISFAVGEMDPSRLNELVERLAQNKKGVDGGLRPLEQSSAPTRQSFWYEGDQAERIIWQSDYPKIQRGALLVTAPPLVYGLVVVGEPAQVSKALKAKHLKILR